MSVFTATNGIQIERTDAGLVFPGAKINVVPLGSPQIDAPVTLALGEFFRHEEDVRLGRWRWPENPDYVVKHDPLGARLAHVMHEPSLATAVVGPAAPHGLGSPRDMEFTGAARAYFAAHPEPKPWHDAKPGEVWVINPYGCAEGGEPFMATDRGFTRPEMGGFTSLTDTTITEGRRIWPEAKP